MNPNWKSIPLFLTTFLMLSMLIGALPLRAQQMPDESMYAQATDAINAKQYENAATILENCRSQFPDNALYPDATVSLFKIYLTLKAPEKADPLGQDILTRWPKSKYAWQILAAQISYTIANDPEKAQVKSATFIHEAIALLSTADNMKTAEDGVLATDVAAQLYPILLKNGQYAEAKTAHEQVQQIMLKLELDEGVAIGDTRQYYDLLSRAQYRCFSRTGASLYPRDKECLDHWATRYSRLRGKIAYPMLFRARRYAEAEEAHEQVEAAYPKG